MIFFYLKHLLQKSMGLFSVMTIISMIKTPEAGDLLENMRKIFAFVLKYHLLH